METPLVLATEPSQSYELIDSGDGEKLEKIGGYTIIRPDPRIIWQKHMPHLWSTVDAHYIRTSKTEGHWKIRNNPPQNWRTSFGRLVFTLRPMDFKHIGVFPEQVSNWEWLQKKITNYQLRISKSNLKILNLFAYTGGATMAAISVNAHVTHVDSSRGAIEWAKKNILASELHTNHVRFIEDDVYAFLKREARRGNTYDGIIMDPPRFGRGAKGEVFKLEKDLPKLMTAAHSVLSKNPALFLINVYTSDLSPFSLANALSDLIHVGTVEFGELTIRESAGGRLLPCGVFTRWLKE